MSRRGITALHLALLLALAAAPAASAVTRTQARKTATKALGALTKQNAAVLESLAKPVKANTKVGQGGRPTLLKKVKKPAWLFWFDQAPGAAFVHPSVLVLIDKKSGKVVRKQPLGWWPVAGGKRLFVPKVSTRALPRVFPRALAGLKNDCIVTIGDRTDPYFLKGLAAVNAMGNRLGVKVAAATTVADLTKKIDALAAGPPKCVDIMIYIGAHGYAPPGSKVANAGQSALGQVEIKSGSTTEAMNTEDIRNILVAHPKLTFKLVVESCFSGRWETLMAVENLRITLTSAAANEVTWLAVTDPRTGRQVDGKLQFDEGAEVGTPDSPDDPPPFTKGLAQAMDTWAADPNGSDLGAGLGYAGTHREGDRARELGWQHGRTSDRTTERPHGTEETPTTTPVAFSATADGSHRHIGPGDSETCWQVATTPARPGASAHVVTATTDGSIVSGADQNVTLNDSGTFLIRVKIDNFGTYTATVDVTATDGGTAHATGSHVVDSSAGGCPAP